MLSTILSAFTVADIRKKLAFTAMLLLFYRLGSHIPVPGVNTSAVEDIQKQFGGGGVLNFLNVFSGGGLSRIAQYTRYLTVALAFAHSIGYVFLFRSFGASAGNPVVEHFDAPHVFLI